MIVLVQWATTNPADWVSIDLRSTGAAANRWRNLPKKPEPTNASTLDANPGWLFSASIQAVDLYGFDHVAIEPIAGNGVRAYGWVDDTTDPTFQYRWGEVWEFREGWADRTMTLVDGSTMRHRGPDQRKTVYAENLTDMAKFAPKECGGLPVELRPWSQWTMPPAAITAHGIWVQPDTLWQRHFEVRRRPDWREWTPVP